MKKTPVVSGVFLWTQSGFDIKLSPGFLFFLQIINYICGQIKKH